MYSAATDTNSENPELEAKDLTEPEKTALIASWKIIKNDLKQHAQNIFVIFFEQYPDYLAKFSFAEDNSAIIENQALHAHSINVMNVIGTLIEYGIKDPDLFKCTVVQLVRNHTPRSVSQTDVRAIFEVFSKYFYRVVEKQKTPTLVSALEAFIEKLVQYFEPEIPDSETD